jgi:hypothetical protein
MAIAENYRFRPNAPASEEAIAALQSALGRPLPSSYLAFLRRANGGEGFVGEWYAMLWRCEDLIEYNRDYQVEELAPGFCLIGSNGGGEAYAFNLSTGSSALLQLPFIGMESQYADEVASSFDSFFGTAQLGWLAP